MAGLVVLKRSMKYKHYAALDFANDAFFIRWIKHPDEESEFFWRTFMNENHACLAAIEEARALILSLDFEKLHLPQEALNTMRNQLWMHVMAEKQRETRPKQRHGWWLAAAAVALCSLALSGYLFLKIDGNVNGTLASGGPKKPESIRREGKNSMILLEDGSRIWLNDSSTITYHHNINARPTRDIYLEGEAFFEVAKDADHPFIVHTSTIKIKVLGTEFSVKSYPADTTVETTLVSGKVHIEQSDERGRRVSDIELKPNQRAVFHKESKIINVRDLKNAARTVPKRNTLVFDEEPVKNVLHQLELWYDAEFHIDTDKLDCKLTATIENESLEEVLNLLKMTHGISYRIAGTDVFISGAFCK